MAKSRWSGSQFLTAVGLTVGFYLLVESPLLKDSLIWRYTTGHPVEHASVGLFVWSLLELGRRWRQLGREKSALTSDWFQDVPADASFDVQHLEDSWRREPPELQQAWIGQRLEEALTHLRSCQTGEDLQRHLRHRAELAADASHGAYALIRVVTWMIPILGFLGTVLGITIAIANISPEQLENSLSTVTGGLAVAFDTTALALGLSMVIVTLHHFVEQRDQTVLDQVRERAETLLEGRVLRVHPDWAPYWKSLQQMGQQLLLQSHDLVARQVDLWSSAWSRFEDRLDLAQETQVALLQQTLNALRDERSSMAHRVDVGTDRLAAAIQQMTRLTESCQQLLQNQQRLVGTQSQFVDNLRLLEQSSKLDETMHSLAAAIHLLTARQALRPETTKAA